LTYLDLYQHNLDPLSANGIKGYLNGAKEVLMIDKSTNPAGTGEKVITMRIDGSVAGELSMLEDEKTVWLAMILIKQHFKGFGIGRVLFDEALKYSKSVGKTLLSGKINGASTRLLRNFEREGIIRTHMPTPEEERQSARFAETMLVIE
jgi:GNAT superfamily N-acetyltransferase